MMKKWKSVGISVRNADYPYTGKQIRDAVDTLFAEIWNQLDATIQKRMQKDFATEIAILDWGVPNDA